MDDRDAKRRCQPTKPKPKMLNPQTLNADELERYARPPVLWEVGGPALFYLGAAGGGTLGVVDDDAVSLSNLQRQVIHATHDVGRSKVESAQAAIDRLNPHVAV